MSTCLTALLPLLRRAVLTPSRVVLTACGGGGSDEPSPRLPRPVPDTVPAAVAGHATRMNEVRASVGLAPLSWDTRLAQAAQSHSDYLTRHATVGHFEDPALPGFTGEGFAERAQRFGYPQAVGETIIHGNATTYEEGCAYLDALLYSPCHRAFMLATDIDEFGVGGPPLTTVFGRSGARQRLVAVMFPFDQQQNVNTAVVLSLSGTLSGRVTVERFSLRHRATGAEVAVKPWPAESSGAVLFEPESHLEFGTWYDYTIKGTVDGLATQKTVSFKTH